MSPEQHKKCSWILDYYKYEQQEDIAVEELSECIQAIMKYRRNRYRKQDAIKLISELADVAITLAQVEMIIEERLSYSEDVDCLIALQIDEKLDRQMKRIEDEKNG